MKLYSALREDSQQGWVWLQNSSFPERSIVKITNTKVRKSIYCEALQIDNNFLKAYNKPPRISITNPQTTLVINGWYRAKLGGIHSQTDVDLTVTRCNSGYGKFMACIYHPQTVVRVAAWLGAISVVLGFVGIIISIYG